MDLIPPEKARILVAEDHPLSQMFVRQFLKKFNVGHFEVVPDGAQAVKAYESGNWDVVLMDCHMPGMTGYDATRAIRDLEMKTAAPAALIIAMTANTMEGEREKCLASGMDEYIGKPIRVCELRRILSRRLAFTDAQAEQPEGQAARAEDAPLDLAALRGAAEGNAVVESEMARAFISQSEENMRSMRQSCSTRNDAELKESAHMFKGGAGMIGAARLAELCDRVVAFEGTHNGHMALVEAVGKEYSRVKYYLEELGLLDQDA